MTIRNRLIIINMLMFSVIAILGSAYLSALERWETAGEKWSTVYLQDARVEQLRSALFREVSWALDVLGGDRSAISEVWRLDSIASGLVRELTAATRTVEEREHIEGIAESHHELQWTLKRFVQSAMSGVTVASERDRSRLRELAEEAADDVTALTQYYRSYLARSLEDATRWGRYTEMATGAVIVIAGIQIILLVVLLRRWLVEPVTRVVQATHAISRGQFDTRLDAQQQDEWGHLSRAINRMASALGSMSQRLKSTERMATLGEAAAFTAHNIKNPLAGIRMTAQVTREDLGPESHSVAESLDDIVTAVDRLDSWLGRFLDFARPIEPRIKPIDVADLLTRIIRLAKQRFSDVEVQFIRPDSAGDILIPADEALLEQALYSILANACESGTDCVTVTLAQNATEDDRMVVIDMVDSGCGIDPAMKDRLFEPFQSDKDGGTGLGLAHAKIIIDLHGGTIDIESSQGSGTRVKIRLRIDEVPFNISDSGP